jgi:Flp pilus assembly pilin Flp
MKRTLRILVMTEIVLGIGGIICEIYTQQFLPNLLQAHLKQTQQADLTAIEWAVLAVGLGLIALLIVAWIALWRLSRHARLLYTFACAIALPLTIFLGPYVRSGIAEAIEQANVLTAGMILGILYFGGPNPVGQSNNPLL